MPKRPSDNDAATVAEVASEKDVRETRDSQLRRIRKAIDVVTGDAYDEKRTRGCAGKAAWDVGSYMTTILPPLPLPP